MRGSAVVPAAGPLLLLLLLLPHQLAAAQASDASTTAAGSTDAAFQDTPVDPTTTAAAAIVAPAGAGAAAARPKVTTPTWVGRPKDDVGKQRLPQADQATTDVNLASTAAASRPKRFIVQLKSQSAAALVGHTIIPAAPTAAGEDVETSTSNPSVPLAARSTRVDRITPASAAAAQVIHTEAAAVAAAAGVTTQVTHRYSYALSGFAVEAPSAAQLAALAADPKVLSVSEDRIASIRTFSTPQFLGLKQSVWNELGGVEGYSGAGENVIIGVIDTGAWWDKRPGTNFLDSNYWPGGNSVQQDYRQLSDWQGVCSAAVGSIGNDTQRCNNKVVGCRFYSAGWGSNNEVLSLFPSDELSCRDVSGHGTHTAATAGGNYGPTTSEVPTGMAMSGMAPRARLAIYKGLWGDEGLGTSSDLIAATEDAIKDGADILSYSVGSSDDTGTFRGDIFMAFMNAARAGIFVSAAGGNSGPAPSVGAISPWVTSVAASTHDRIKEAELTLGNGQSLTSEQVATRAKPVGPFPLVYGANVATDNFTVADVTLCAPYSLNASAIRGPTIVVCDRGTYLFTEKVAEVKRVGGQAMVLMNVPGGREDLITHDLEIEYIHLTATQREAVLAYLGSAASATATLGATRLTFGVTAPAMAGFSSRGPIPIANALVMKPDITAPGVAVYAPYSNRFAYLQGTSMATPHISGIAALIKDKYPQWSPMAIKSAMMTTAYQTTRTGNVGQPFGTALDYGAGHVDPAKALNPGLVFDSTFEDWQRFLCDVEPYPGDDCDTLCSMSSKRSVPGDVTSPVVLESFNAVVTPQHKPRPPGWPRPSPSPSPRPPQPPPPPPPSPPATDRLCDAANFNSPSIAGEVSGGLTVVRTLTSVLPKSLGRVTFTAQGSADAGSLFDVFVSPAAFKVRGKESRKVTISVKARADTPLDKYQFGQVIWKSSKGHTVRIPIAVKFAEFVAPSYIQPALRVPDFEYRIKIGADAATTVTINNLGAKAGDITEVAVTAVQSNSTTPNLQAPGVGKVDITVPSGNKYFAVGIFADDVARDADLDLYLYNGETELGQSTSAGSTEVLEALEGLEPGKYTAYIYPSSLPTKSLTAYLHVWMFPAPSASNVMKVSPSSVKVVPGDMGCCPITFAFSGLDFSGRNRYIGAISYTRADGKPTNPTIVYLL